MLPQLPARIRPNRTRRPGEQAYVMACGVRDCAGVLATLGVGAPREYRARLGARLFLSADIPAGFVQLSGCRGAEVEVGKNGPTLARWALGRHAAKSRRHAPRRPRKLPFDVTRFAPTLDEDEMVRLVRHLTCARPPEAGPDGRALSFPHAWLFSAGDLAIVCPQCGRESVLTAARVAALEAKLEQQEQEEEQEEVHHRRRPARAAHTLIS